MKIGSLLFLILLTFSFPSFSQERVETTYLDLNKISPSQLLSAVRCNSDTAKNLRYLSLIHPVPVNWVKRADAEYLIKFIYSDEQCKCLLYVFSSYLPKGDEATIGGIAMDMIDSYRKGTACFPNSAHCTKTDLSRAEEIMTWWRGELEKIYGPSEK